MAPNDEAGGPAFEGAEGVGFPPATEKNWTLGLGTDGGPGFGCIGAPPYAFDGGAPIAPVGGPPKPAEDGGGGICPVGGAA
jgi:hypothetical protein